MLLLGLELYCFDFGSKEDRYKETKSVCVHTKSLEYHVNSAANVKSLPLGVANIFGFT